jgi:DNA-binding FadR family transcriptional regulator
MELHLDPLSSSPLPDQLAHDLLRRILRGEFDHDNMLPSERQLCMTYAVSRSVVREAIKWLNARGIVTSTNGVGAIINRDITASTVEAMMLAFHYGDVRLRDLIDTRIVLEPKIAALAAIHATSDQIAGLYASCDAMEQLDVSAGEIQASINYNQVNVDFHLQISRASRNPVLTILVDLLIGVVWRHERTANQIIGLPRYQKTAREHRQIVTAIAQRDAEAARVAMMMHLDLTQRLLRDNKHLDQRLQIFTDQ